MTNSSKDFVVFQNVSFLRNGRTVLEDLSLRVQSGKIVVILGPSGVGKTTLLRLIGAQLCPSSGSVFVDGMNVHQVSRKQLYDLRKRLGMLFQSGGLFTHISVFENVAFPLREHTDLPEFMLRDQVLLTLESVGLRGAHRLMPEELSGGMARRVAMARAIVMDPSLMLYDEPFAGQDPITMGVLIKLIKHLNKVLGMTSILVSHDVQESLCIADYVYVIAGSKIIAEGTPKQILNMKEPALYQFIQGLPDGPVPFQYPSVPVEEDVL